MAAKVFTVAELVAYLQIVLEYDPMLADLWLSGEVANTVTSAAGHTYFTLREENTSFRCVLFARYPGAMHVANGAHINVHGRVGVYAARGEIQLTADMVQAAGAGALTLEFEALRAQLEREGLFDQTRKRPLPAFPKRIGVVTSETGAVYHDIAQTLGRRYPIGELIFCPAAVQGDLAPEQVARSIRRLNAIGNVDVMIVGRGGGSLEDLHAFNTDVVARAIHGSHVPVISAVGHETDVTIADWVADVRAATPTAAAELAAPNVLALASETRTFIQRAEAALRQTASRQARALQETVTRLGRLLPDTGSLRQAVDDVLAQARHAVSALAGQRRAELAGATASLEALSPLAVLGRGYAALMASDGSRVTSVASLSPGDSFRATLFDGSLDARVAGDDAAEAQRPRPASRIKSAPEARDSHTRGPRGGHEQGELL